jgi:tRNA(Ile)-lysidine synthase
MEGMVLAVSGGPDSMALLVSLSQWRQRTSYEDKVEVMHVHHGLRANACEDADLVRAVCQREALPFTLVTLTTPPPVTRIQEWAREQRYYALVQHAQRLGIKTIVTAHTCDDQAETLLMRLAAGSGLAGLSGMKPFHVRDDQITIARPFLSVSKARLIATCEHTQTPYVMDPSNQNTRFTRVRWRGLLPLLSQEGLTPERLMLFSQRAGEAEDALQIMAQRLLQQSRTACSSQWHVQYWPLEPFAVVCRALLLLLRMCHPTFPPASMRLERMEQATRHLMEACRTQSVYRQSLAGCVISLGRQGLLTLQKESPRKRGRDFVTSTLPT